MASGRRRLRLVMVLAALAAPAVGGPEWLQRAPVLCPFRRLLDVPCPGCGMTRALSHLLHGEWAAALALHPLSAVVAGAALVVILRDAVELLWQARPLARREVIRANSLSGVGNSGLARDVGSVLALPGRTELD